MKPLCCCCPQVQYTAMQYSLLTNTGVEVLGGILFFLTAIFILKDKLQCEKAAAGTAIYLFFSRLRTKFARF